MSRQRAETGRAAAVLGLGSLGASLALALKGSARFATVAGWDPDLDVVRRAQKSAVADRYPGKAPDAARGAAAVFLAVTADEMGASLTAIAPHLSPGTVVCSLDEAHERAGSLAAGILPASVSFAAAHPVLRDLPGPLAPPSSALFRGGVMCLSPAAGAHPDAVAYLSGLAEALEMEAFFVDAREHDAFFAGIGRLPSVLAAAYVRLVTREKSWPELGRIAGGEFRQIASLADVEPWREQPALDGSRDHLVRWLDGLVTELNTLRDALQDGQVPKDFYATASDAVLKWKHDRALPAVASDLPRPSPLPRRRFGW